MATDLLQGSSDVEALETPQRSAPSGCHSHTPSANFRMDAQRRPTGERQEAQRRSSGNRGYCSDRVDSALIPAVSYPMSPRVSVTCIHVM